MKCQKREMTGVDDTVTDMHTEASAAAELSDDSEIGKEEVEAPTETSSELDDIETEDDDGIHVFFL